MDESEGYTATIPSYSYVDSVELLHMRVLVHDVELEDWPDPDQKSIIRIPYVQGECLMFTRINALCRRSLPSWIDFTWYRDWVVPMSVIEKMKEIEGMIGEYDQRRQVTKATWDVLMEWYENVVEVSSRGYLSFE